MRLLRILQLDQSDASVFDVAASSGEWCVPGAFMFLNDTAQTVKGKKLQAFRNGFLGVKSFGWASIAEIAEISDEEFQSVAQQLAQQFVDRLGAPDIDTALPVALDELTYASGACEAAPGTLIAVTREFSEDGVEENLHVVHQNAGGHDDIKIWEWVPDAAKDS